MNHDWVFIFLSVGSLALFSFLSVSTWADARQRERAAFYRAETIKRITEMPNADTGVVVEFLREQDRISQVRKREGLKLGGLVTAAVGIGLMLFLRAIASAAPIYVLGLIPLLIGIVFLIYAYLLAPKS